MEGINHEADKLNEVVASKISAEIKAELQAAVKRSKVTKSEFIRNLINEALKVN